ncbi:hypothetical protein [Salimicrobium flavidum]|uniref:Uncharacterized protein n=1 Tax=Salimicrobium flavidum TaxID=570947 RepID=A0A1N7J0H3_9BACI|nr:hypothetical protein [Salimicrobium flavidum]SIS42868.1 hypothetical protein SAMN05421687_103121 [Salimicrobium flavidum]
MSGKVTFKRSAVQSNVEGETTPAFSNLVYVIYDVSPVVKRFSQLRIKSGWQMECREKEVYAISPNQKKEQMMKGIIGDESPLSYIQAASCYHQLNNNIAGLDFVWEEEAVIDDTYVTMLHYLGFWPFGDLSRSMNPLFFYDSLHHPVVIFFTYHREVKNTIVKHIHRFDYEGYGLKYGCRTWAIHNKDQVTVKRIK